MKILASLVGALALASTAQAATYDAFTSFDGTQGAGNFRYLSLGAMPGQPATLLTAPASVAGCVVTSDACLQLGGSLPGVYKSTAAAPFHEGTYTVPNDQLLVHPGSVNPVAIFFIAPTAGDYDFTVTFNVLDNAPSGVAVFGISNGGGVTATAVPLGALGSGNLTVTRSGTKTLAAGEFLGIFVSPAGAYNNDSTGVNFTLSTAGVPEPGAWALMIAGFGLAGGALRRRAYRAA